MDGAHKLPTVEDFMSYRQQMIEETGEAANWLAEQGWFTSIDMEINIPGDLMNGFFNHGVDVDAFLMRFYRERLGELEEKILDAWPHRSAPISESFWAHSTGHFFLSVPVMVAQADGIAWDLIDKYTLFEGRDRDKESRIEKLMGVPDCDLIDALLTPLKKNPHIARGAMKGDEPGEQLRRHAVLHGRDAMYGTELIALKAVSLLSHIAIDLPAIQKLGVSRVQRRKEALEKSP